MPPVGFEPAISAIELLQTHALDRAATGAGRLYHTVRSESRCTLVNGAGSLEVMSTSVYKGLNPFNFIRKHFLQICL